MYAEITDSIYFDPPNELDLRVRRFLGSANEIVETPASRLNPDSPQLRQIGEAEGEQLLRSLDTALNTYVQAADQSIVQLRITLWGLLAALLFTLLLEGFLIFRPAFNSLLSRTRELHELAQTDPLTGCHNRRSFMLLAQMQHDRQQRYHDECAVIMLDIDYFKSINDTYGHHVGDHVIKALAETCIQHLRATDFLGRLGGEEFAVLLPATSLHEAVAAAEKLRKLLEKKPVATNASTPLNFTVSLGVSTMRESDESALDALNRADARLYEAKRSGRNRVASDSAQET